MSLSDMFIRDSRAIYRNTREFAELVLYKRKATGEVCEFEAIVFRDPIKRTTRDRGRSSTSPMEIEIAQELVATPALGDMVKVRPRLGADAEWMLVTEIVPRGATDGGTHLLGLGRR